jgi:alpha-beta hydrolase superfamily lysophospholipase
MAVKDVSVVMAHGGWADGSSWARVITGLAAHGIKAVAAPLPLTGTSRPGGACLRGRGHWPRARRACEGARLRNRVRPRRR